MTNEELVKLLQELSGGMICGKHVIELEQAASRIKALTAALEKFDDLIQYQYTGSREAMSAMAEAAQEGARVLGRGAWKEAGQPWLWTYDPHLKEKQP
jgi:hypothetical protein